MKYIDPPTQRRPKYPPKIGKSIKRKKEHLVIRIVLGIFSIIVALIIISYIK